MNEKAIQFTVDLKIRHFPQKKRESIKIRSKILNSQTFLKLKHSFFFFFLMDHAENPWKLK